MISREDGISLLDRIKPPCRHRSAKMRMSLDAGLPLDWIADRDSASSKLRPASAVDVLRTSPRRRRIAY